MGHAAPDICSDFLTEAREIVDQLGAQMVTLERVPDDSRCLNGVFRGFHTIKGGAGFLGFPEMVVLCHAVEERLNAARSTRFPLDAATFDATQQAIDLLADMLDAIGTGGACAHPPVGVLEALRLPSPSAVAIPPVDPVAAAVDADGEIDFEALLDSLHGKGGAPGALPPRLPVAAHDPAPAPLARTMPTPTPPAGGIAREPETTVRVDVRRLDAMINLVGELVLARNRLKVIRPRLRDDDLDRAVGALDTATSRLQAAVMSARMQPVGRVFARFPKLARDVARQLGKAVELQVTGAETELDRNLVEALADPLVHLVRNAIDHGIESPAQRRAAGKPEAGTVQLSARQEGDHVMIEIQDDGAGIDPEKIRRSACDKGLIDAEAADALSSDECLQMIFLPGFSTRGEVTDLSGRGVGMDVVQSRIRELSGQVQIHSRIGVGTRFAIRVPLTLAILPTLLLELDKDIYAVPLVRVIEVLGYDAASSLRIDGHEMADLRERPTPLLHLRQWLGLQSPPPCARTSVVLQSGEQRFCLVVDRVPGREEVVIKALPRTLRGLPGYAGASLVGDGRMALILDVDALLESATRSSSTDANR